MGVTADRAVRAPAVRRAIAVLDALAFERRARASDIVRSVGLPKSSASDLIGTLTAERMIARSGDDLVLGTAFVEMAAGFVGGIATLRRFGIGWERSAELRGHTVTVQSLIGLHSVCVGVRLGPHVLPYTPRAGSRLPLCSGERLEPVARAVGADDLLRSVDRFPERDGGREDIARLLAGAQGDPLSPSPSSTGNLEIGALVSSGDDRGGPVVATLHLPPAYDGEVAPLAAALTQFARDLRPDRG